MGIFDDILDILDVLDILERIRISKILQDRTSRTQSQLFLPLLEVCVLSLSQLQIIKQELQVIEQETRKLNTVRF